MLISLFLGVWIGVACGIGLMNGLECLERRFIRRSRKSGETAVHRRPPSRDVLYRDGDGNCRVLPCGTFERACAAADARLALIRSEKL